MTTDEQRKFKRLNTNWITRIRATRLTDSVKLRIEQVKNVSLGGIFVEMQMPFPLETVVEFGFEIPNYAEEIRGRGIVRWSNNGSVKGQPPGMGIEFVEVLTGNKDVIKEYVHGEAAKEFITVLTRSRLHQNLLRFYCRKLGESFPVDVLAQFLGARNADLLECLKDFSLYKIVRFAKDTVTFVAAENAEVAHGIRVWYDALDHGTTPRGGTPRSGTPLG